jgi:hypothetical protein
MPSEGATGIAVTIRRGDGGGREGEGGVSGDALIGAGEDTTFVSGSVAVGVSETRGGTTSITLFGTTKAHRIPSMAAPALTHRTSVATAGGVVSEDKGTGQAPAIYNDLALDVSCTRTVCRAPLPGVQVRAYMFLCSLALVRETLPRAARLRTSEVLSSVGTRPQMISDSCRRITSQRRSCTFA